MMAGPVLANPCHRGLGLNTSGLHSIRDLMPVTSGIARLMLHFFAGPRVGDMLS